MSDVLERAAQKALEDPKTQEIIRRAQVFGELKESAAWRELFEEVKRKKARFMESLSKRLLTGEKVDQREIDFHRGFYLGAKWILSHPEQAEEALERAARDAWLLGLDESEEE